MISDDIIPVWKETGITSYDVVDRIKSLHKGVKVGHCGTLDPFAEGVLIICKGDAIKSVEKFMNLPKEYKATITLGLETDTLDNTGDVIKIDKKIPLLDEDYIIDTLNKFKGEQLQTPPYFSALKFKGINLYKYARKGIFIRKRPRKIFIDTIKFVDYKDSKITFLVTCSKGTYIRSLAKDIAVSLNTYGHLSKLVRTSVGPYNIKNTYNLNTLLLQ